LRLAVASNRGGWAWAVEVVVREQDVSKERVALPFNFREGLDDLNTAAGGTETHQGSQRSTGSEAWRTRSGTANVAGRFQGGISQPINFSAYGAAQRFRVAGLKGPPAMIHAPSWQPVCAKSRDGGRAPPTTT